MNKLGERIRHSRTAKGLSLRKFAKDLGISAQYLSTLETRGSAASEDRIVEIAKKLGENSDEMLALADKIPSDVKAIILKNPKEICEIIRGLAVEG